MKTKKGFTLIELLVVISIIALLLSVILPSLGKAKEAAKGVLCRNNVRQMAVAFATYSMDNGGKMFNLDYGSKYWFRQIAPYLGDDFFQDDPTADGSGVMTIGICPSTKVTPWADNPTDSQINGTCKETWGFKTFGDNKVITGSYGINAWLLPDPPRSNSQTYYQQWGGNIADTYGKYFDRYSNVRSDVPLLADSFRMDSWPMSVDNPPSEKKYLKELNTSSPYASPPHQPGYFMQRFTVDRHGMAVNVGFVGGHVDKIDIEDLWMLRWNKKFGIRGDIQMPTR